MGERPDMNGSVDTDLAAAAADAIEVLTTVPAESIQGKPLEAAGFTCRASWNRGISEQSWKMSPGICRESEA